MDNKIDQLKTEVDEIKKGLNELKNNVSLPEVEKKNKAEDLKSQAETTKKKIENEIQSLESKTDNKSKKKKEEIEALLNNFNNETTELYTSIINTLSTNTPTKTTQPESENKGIFSKTFVLAVNYGGQDEILRAMKILNDSGEEITKENLEKYMDFGGLPTVDLVIRTKQKLAKRLSGFMLWRIGYAQLYFTDLYCPQFTVGEFGKAIEWWNNSLDSQNFGK